MIGRLQALWNWLSDDGEYQPTEPDALTLAWLNGELGNPQAFEDPFRIEDDDHVIYIIPKKSKKETNEGK